MDVLVKDKRTAPRAASHPNTYVRHGHAISDEFSWLRAANWQEVMRNPDCLGADIRAYLDAENTYAKAVMADTARLQDTLFGEMKGRIKEDDTSVPANDGPWAYFVRYREGGQYPLFCRRPRAGKGPETILLDGDAMAQGKSYFSIGGASHSGDHALLAYGVDDKGSEFYTLRVRDLATGEDMDDVMSDTSGASIWSADGQYLFYVRLDANHRSRWVCRHRLGSGVADDVIVYDEPDPAFFVGIGQTQDRKYIEIVAHEHETTEVHLVDSAAPLAAPRLVIGREAAHQYSIEHNAGTLYILTNKDAEDFRIVACPAGDARQENWRDVVPHLPGRLILSFDMLAGHLVHLERFDGLPRIIVQQLADGAKHEIAFDEEAYSLGLMSGYEFDTTKIRFTYSSMTTPSEVFDYDLETRERELRKIQEVPSGHDPSHYVTRRLHAKSHDGAEVPITLLYHRDTPLDGTAPLYLYGYGAYGIAIPSAFSTNRLSLVDRGFIYAVAHTRGGKDKGYRWYRDGKREKKKNTFLDFLAAGEYLIAERYTTRGNIVAEGRSAGGMLMGAVANMQPDLFLAIVAGVPFVDVLNTMLDESLPLTPPEWNEWGNPITDEAAFDYIRSYSPYDNVEAKAYPHMLVTAGLTDPRVTYWEPAKWVARLRERRSNDNLLIMHIEMEAGHGGKSGRFDALKDLAFDYAFALKVAGKAG